MCVFSENYDFLKRKGFESTVNWATGESSAIRKSFFFLKYHEEILRYRLNKHEIISFQLIKSYKSAVQIVIPQLAVAITPVLFIISLIAD